MRLAIFDVETESITDYTGSRPTDVYEDGVRDCAIDPLDTSRVLCADLDGRFFYADEGGYNDEYLDVPNGDNQGLFYDRKGGIVLTTDTGDFLLLDTDGEPSIAETIEQGTPAGRRVYRAFDQTQL